MFAAAAAAAIAVGDFDAAREAVEEALSRSGGDAVGRAEALRVRGRIAAATGSGDFRTDFAAAGAGLAAAGEVARERECRTEFAQALEDTGDPSAALAQWKQAALASEPARPWSSALPGVQSAERRA